VNQYAYIIFYIIFIAVGALVGGKLIAPRLKRKYGAEEAAKKSPLVRGISAFQFGAILFIVFLMGLRIGADRRVFDSLGTVGLAALVITIATLGFSLLFVYLVRRFMGFDKLGVRYKAVKDRGRNDD